jgi:hypothetical protein
MNYKPITDAEIKYHVADELVRFANSTTEAERL